MFGNAEVFRYLSPCRPLFVPSISLMGVGQILFIVHATEFGVGVGNVTSFLQAYCIRYSVPCLCYRIRNRYRFLEGIAGKVISRLG